MAPSIIALQVKFFIRVESVNSPLALVDIEKICINMARHIQVVSQGHTQISEMKVHFKIDQNSMIWLLSVLELKLKNYFNTLEMPNLSKLLNSTTDLEFRGRLPENNISYEKISQKMKINKLKTKITLNKDLDNCPVCMKEKRVDCKIELIYIKKNIFCNFF